MGNNIFRALMFALLLFTVTHVSSANSFYANALEVSPGEVEELSFMLDNEQEFIGFQFDLVLPEGLEAVLDGDAVRCSLSGRADDTYSLFSNVLADGTVRIGAFSVQNNPFRGNSGSLLNVALRSSDSFAGGTLQIRNIRFVDVNNNDVILPNTSCAVTPRSIFVESLVMSQTELSLREGQTATLSVNVLPDNAENKGVTWSSSNDAVATVSADGLVTAISLGEAIVTATAADGSGVTATCRVTVGATLAEGVSVSADGETTLKVGGSVQLRATVTPETATDKSVSWSTGNANVATVDGNGLVTAVGVGTATITCTNSAGLTATIDITVERTPVSSITLNRETAALRVSGTIQLSATVLPETATDKTVTWSSSDDAVATVSGDGLVTATAIGEALITATAADGSGVTATCRVTVGATPAEGVSITADGETTLKVGGTAQLRATVTPDAATDKSVSWSTGNANVATVDGNGLVTAVGVGTATITCTNSAGQTATIDIIVEPTLVTSISLDRNTATMNAGESFALVVTILPEDATDKSVTWKSSNDGVATVSVDGVVTAVGAGTADVTATANDGSGLSATCVVTVKEQVTISWEQTIEAVVGDVVTLEAEASNGAPIAFRTVRTAGGYVTPVVTYADGEWTATFPATGAVILEAYIESEDGTAVCEPVRKAFNVLPDRDVMLIDGIYYRYTDNTHSALTVTYGYRQYEGDVIVPSVAGGLPVVSVGNRAFYSNVGLVSVTLSEGLERIESDQAFGNSPNLSSVVIPSTVSYIGSYTFNVDKGLSEIHCRVKKPSGLALFGGEDIFNGFVDYDNCILYVPSGTAEAYREADVWRNFKNIVEEQPEPVLVALLSLDDDEIELNVGETATLRTVVYPSSATNQSVEWTSSDEAVATVDAGGEVLAVGQGTAVVTATTVDGSGLSASCAVTVNLPSGISAVGLDGVRIVTDNGRIVITGLSADDIISVYTISGSLVYRGANRPVTVQAPGVYLVSIKGHTYKVVVK